MSGLASVELSDAFLWVCFLLSRYFALWRRGRCDHSSLFCWCPGTNRDVLLLQRVIQEKKSICGFRAICRRQKCKHILLRYKGPTWVLICFSGLFFLPGAFPWLQFQRRGKWKQDSTAVQWKQSSPGEGAALSVLWATVVCQWQLPARYWTYWTYFLLLLLLFIYSHVHTLFGSFLHPAPQTELILGKKGQERRVEGDEI
jgi:hypothetical protein